MIFLCAGTQLPFNRLVATVDRWAKDACRSDVVGQVSTLGPDDYRPRHMAFHEMMPPKEFEAHIRESDLVIAHAGMGVIITALLNRTPIVVMPRRADLEEHRSDHQIATARQLSHLNGIDVAWSETDVQPTLERKLVGREPTASIKKYADPGLISRVRSLIEEA